MFPQPDLVAAAVAERARQALQARAPRRPSPVRHALAVGFRQLADRLDPLPGRGGLVAG